MTTQSQDWSSEEAAAVQIVEDFFTRLGAGEIDGAQRHLGPEVLMIFPGNRHYRSLAELAEVSRRRYRKVDKSRDRYDAATTSGGVVVVSTGTLFGENLHGVRFANVRYVDRFLVIAGRIHLQQVWNDLAESGVLNARDVTQIGAEWRAPESAGAADAPAPAGTVARVRRTARAEWAGKLRGGEGSLALASGASPPLGFALDTRRSERASTTSPEELIAAAHASCFAMALRGALDRESGTPAAVGDALSVDATCTLQISAAGWWITGMSLNVSATGVPRETLDAAIVAAEERCAVSMLMRGNVEVSVTVSEAARE